MALWGVDMRIDFDGNPVNDYVSAQKSAERPKISIVITSIIALIISISSPALVFAFIYYSIKFGLWVVGG
jgi:hypothetical protein